MTTNNKITALIAVKGNSERVEKKNVRPFADSSLLQIKLEQIQSLNVFDEIIVSSESDDVLAMCEPFDVITHKRDSFYSTSHVPMSSVYEHLAELVKTKYIAWIPVTNPLVGGEIYKDAVKSFTSMNHDVYDSLVSVNNVREYLYHNGKPLNFSLDPWPRSQDLSGTYSINFAINIISKKDMINNRATIGNNPYFFVIEKDIAIDIDYMEDFILAETLYKSRRSKNDS